MHAPYSHLEYRSVTKEPVGLARQDGKRPDGLTLIPWQAGKPLTWDVTVASTLAALYRSSSARSAGAAADLVASRKEAKYTSLTNSYISQPIAMESHGAFSTSALSFLTTLGERLNSTSGDLREMSYLFQRLSVIIYSVSIRSQYTRALFPPMNTRTSSHSNF